MARGWDLRGTLCVERGVRHAACSVAAFKIFGSPHQGLTEAELGAMLSKLGMVLSKRELHSLFRKWDENGASHHPPLCARTALCRGCGLRAPAFVLTTLRSCGIACTGCDRRAPV